MRSLVFLYFTIITRIMAPLGIKPWTRLEDSFQVPTECPVGSNFQCLNIRAYNLVYELFSVSFLISNVWPSSSSSMRFLISNVHGLSWNRNFRRKHHALVTAGVTATGATADAWETKKSKLGKKTFWPGKSGLHLF